MGQDFLPLSRNNPFLKTILEAIQVSCIGWVLLHLLLLIMYGTVLIAEKSLLILTLETVVVSIGLSAGCIRFLSTIKGKNESSTA